MEHFRGKLLGLVAADLTKLINKDFDIQHDIWEKVTIYDITFQF